MCHFSEGRTSTVFQDASTQIFEPEEILKHYLPERRHAALLFYWFPEKVISKHKIRELQIHKHCCSLVFNLMFFLQCLSSSCVAMERILRVAHMCVQSPTVCPSSSTTAVVTTMKDKSNLSKRWYKIPKASATRTCANLSSYLELSE